MFDFTTSRGVGDSYLEQCREEDDFADNYVEDNWNDVFEFQYFIDSITNSSNSSICSNVMMWMLECEEIANQWNDFLRKIGIRRYWSNREREYSRDD